MPKTRALLTTIFSGLLLAACAGPSPRELQAQARAEALRSSGYRPARSATPELALQRWVVRGEALPVDLSFPAGGADGLPLIVYLPGMGEAAQGGLQWRQAWAQAGYAVLSVQPLDGDANAWSSELARAADFKGLARERRAAPQLQARQAWLRAVLDEARRRAAAGDPLWRRVDFTRMGLAGYELGTQAVLAAEAAQLGARALLAISPLAGDAAAAAVPLLVVSAERDSDPTGLIAGPLAGRARAAFAGGAAPQHYLLTLNGATTHQQLSGSGGEDGEALAERSGHGGGGAGARRHREAPQAPQRYVDASAGVAIEAATTAFWDATLRDRAEARGWLADAAAPWLHGVAVWDRR